MAIFSTRVTLSKTASFFFRWLLVFFLILLFLPRYGFTQEKLNKLVTERQQLHQQWQQSEQKKSGLFGNRTKKDMIGTNDWMARIIQKDNQIIEELEMLNKIETTEISHEREDYKFIAQKQQGDINILKRSIATKEQELEDAKKKHRTTEWAAFILFLSTVGLGFLYVNTRRKGTR